MLFLKETLQVTITAGTGAGNTSSLRGIIQQFIITPIDSNGAEVTNAAWDLNVTDSDGDKMDVYTTQTGRFDNRTPLIIGRDRLEKYTLTFANVTNAPARMRIIFKVKEAG